MTHDERVYHHLYETLEGIAEQSERIASLEELVLDFMQCPSYLEDCKKCRHAKFTPKSVTGNWDDYGCTLVDRAEALGIRE